MRFERKRDVIKERNRLLDILEVNKRTIDKLKEELSVEKHKVGTYCNGCVNLLRGKTWCMGAEVEEKICKLDIKCKDRVEKTNEC